MRAAVCFNASIAILLLSLTAAICLTRTPYRRRRVLSPLNCVLAGVFFAAFALFLPIHFAQFSGESLRPMKSVLVSIHSTMRLFVLDGEFDTIHDFAAALPQNLRFGYTTIAAVLYVFAPAMTFGFLLSLFKNAFAYHRLIIHYFSDICVFSELNEKSLALAASMKASSRCLIVFTDVFENQEETVFELCERARELRAVCFQRDIADIDWRFHSSSSRISLFTIGEDEAENIAQSVKLTQRYKSKANFRLYIFASGAESEILFHAAQSDGMRIRRVNPSRSLINQNLYSKGYSLFRDAVSTGRGKKKISVVLLGIGHYGVEMLRALPWFCQMDGYDVSIYAFDQDPKAEDKFSAQCPELMSPEKNGVYREGEAQYTIRIYSGMDIDTAQFMDQIRDIELISYVFVALGEDSRNIRAAMRMRMLCERKNLHPAIQAIVHSTQLKQALEQAADCRGYTYDIDFVGDLNTAYSEGVIIDSELERIALERHLKWGRAEDFWAYEYNYRSSIASVIHMKMRVLCGISGAGQAEEELSDAQRIAIMRLEHRRWNAYMRGEGYVFSGSTAKASRNDLGKMHHDLVPFDQLDAGEQAKDLSVGSHAVGREG